MNIKVLEMSENIRDSSISRDIYDCSKIVQHLVVQSEWVEDISLDDFEYISILTSKAKMLMYKAYCVLKTYMEVENERFKRNKKNYM